MDNKIVVNALATIRENVVSGGKKDAVAYVVGYVTKRLRSKIPTGSDPDKKVLVNKITYTILSSDLRNSITVDYFNPPTTDKMDHENVPWQNFVWLLVLDFVSMRYELIYLLQLQQVFGHYSR
ncbi:MAG: hypothetical protein DRQ41_08450 [Gammaproteobacteria bacterium]|nr:MAG: hypothetical protein DRQ41_08450 [Gammaproteobacteria bacterium]RKZ75602.1 MAG: hypothetical protein DRQ57_06920 [Gammaproteobacteria bacterium]